MRSKRTGELPHWPFHVFLLSLYSQIELAATVPRSPPL